MGETQENGKASNDNVAIEFVLNNGLGETKENGKTSNDDIAIEFALNSELKETRENDKASNDDVTIEFARDGDVKTGTAELGKYMFLIYQDRVVRRPDSDFSTVVKFA